MTDYFRISNGIKYNTDTVTLNSIKIPDLTVFFVKNDCRHLNLQ